MKKTLLSSLAKKYADLKSDIRILPNGRKVVIVASLLGLFTLFIPWFYQGSVWFTAFGKVSIFGFVYMICLISALALICREALYRKGFLGEYSHTLLLFIIFGMGLYTITLQTFVLYELMTYNPRAYIGIGSMFEFLSMGLGLGGVYLSRKFIPQQSKSKLFRDLNTLNTNDIPIEKEGQLSLGIEK